jgi:hypothetical protein
MKELKVWPHLTVIAVVCAVLAGTGVALWMRHRQTTNDQAFLNAARIQRVDGDVALDNNSAGTETDQWVPATVNQPFSTGDRIYTRDNAHASIAFSGRNFARLYPNTSLDVLTLTDRRTQLALRDGSAMFDVGYLGNDELFEVATPYGAVDFSQPGLYNVGIDNGNVIVSVLNGLAQVVGLGGSGRIGKGEVLTLLGQTAADVVLSQIDGRDAGYLLNDYYGYQYPNYYDGRYSDYNAYLNDPNYFDPYRRNVSYQYVNPYLPGLNDLDYYGDWQNVNGYGYAWRPRVDSGWTPYEQGYWMTDYPYGPTWVSTEPWGYTPYHYGRWAYVSNQWFWIPESSSTPLYSPALVAFVPVSQNEVGWVPLGPGDAYAPRYYNANWEPYYFNRPDYSVRYVNLDVPNAVTIVPVDDFTRLDDFRRARRGDRRSLQNVSAVLDPLTLTPLRNAVVHSAWGRGKKDLPPGIEKKLRETRVVTNVDPIAPPFRRDIATSMRVDRINEKTRNKQFKVRDERQTQQGRARVDDSGRPENLEDRRGQQRQIERAAQQAQAERAAQANNQQAQGERVGQPARSKPRDVGRTQPPNVQRPPRINERKPIEHAPGQVKQPRVQQQPRQAVDRGRGAMKVERAPQASAPPRQEKQQAKPQAGGGGNKGGKPAGSPHGQGGGKGKKP